MTEVDPVGAVFAALADPTRRRLLELLGPRPDRSATTLADQLPVSRQAVVQHLAVLAAAGLVTSRRVGRHVLFSVRPEALAGPAGWLTDRAGAWHRSLQSLKRAAESPEDRPGRAASPEGRPGRAAEAPEDA